MRNHFIETSDAGELHLITGVCSACGHKFFPFQTLGCERCGAHGSAITEARVLATGKVHSAVVVWRHRGAGIEAPFQIADVVLDSDVKVRALIKFSVAPALAAGTRVEGLSIGEVDGALPSLRFSALKERS